MLNVLEKTSGKNLYYKKLKLANAKYSAYYKAALKSRDRGDCEWADQTMAKALAVEGRTGSSNLRLAQCYSMHDRYREALAAYARELEIDPEDGKSHQMAVAFAGLKEVDSVFYYLDTIRNDKTSMLDRELGTFFKFIKEDPRYPALMSAHGLPVD